MKATLTLLFFAFVTHAQASYLNVTCSNSHGTLIWEHGHGVSQLTIKNFRNLAPDVVIPTHELKISQRDTISIDEKTTESCSHISFTKTYAEKVTITDEVVGKGKLYEATGREKIEDIVICTHFISSSRYCPVNP